MKIETNLNNALTIASELKSIDLFAQVEENEFEKEIKGELVVYKEGEHLFKVGDPANFFNVILEGVLETYKVIQGNRLPLMSFTRGMTGGEVPLLSGNPHMANGVAKTDIKIFRISKEAFWQMMGSCESVRNHVLKNMSERMKQMTVISFQREKLASLGTMSAGLAHELNNPASAARRAAQGLADTLTQFNILSSEMLKYSMFKEYCLDENYPFQPVEDQIQLEDFKLDMMEQSDREEELGEWLEENFELEKPWDVASSLVSVGFTKEFFEEFISKIVPKHHQNFMDWTHKDVEMRLLTRELKESTHRIAELIDALKSYSYMDKQIERVKVNVHEGIDNTLIILKHKLRKKQINIVKEYSEDLPEVSAYGSELNQVWTNLLDNAIHAIEEVGTITIRTFVSADNDRDIKIEVIDTGVGIPEDVLPRIFEQFFTTKKVGEGTGLGLEFCYRIVANQHKGNIEVESEPGRTCFRVCLPIDLD